MKIVEGQLLGNDNSIIMDVEGDVFMIFINNGIFLEYNHKLTLNMFCIPFDFPYDPLFYHLADMVNSGIVDKSLCVSLDKLLEQLKRKLEIIKLTTYSYREPSKHWKKMAEFLIDDMWYGYIENPNDDVPYSINYNTDCFYIHSEFGKMIARNETTKIEDLASILQQISEIILLFPTNIKSAR